MSKVILVLCDERDAVIAEAMRSALQSRGITASITERDAADETLGDAGRDAAIVASTVVVVVREGGRGNRLLHALEDEGSAGAEVLVLMADGSPDRTVSARTEARIETLADRLAGTTGGAGTPARRRRWLALVVAVVVLLAAALGAFVWLRSSPPGPGGPPVVLHGMLSNAGWMVTFHLREEATELDYKRPTDADFISTGHAWPIPAPTDGPRAKMYVMLTDLEGRVPFLVRYRTPSGATRGPYEAIFDVDAEAVASTKHILADVPQWISCQGAGRRCYFTTLLTYKYAMRAVRYGVDTDVPDRDLRFLPSKAPGIDRSDEMFIDLRDDVSFVTVELVYRDGTVSERKRFAVRE